MIVRAAMRAGLALLVGSALVAGCGDGGTHKSQAALSAVNQEIAHVARGVPFRSKPAVVPVGCQDQGSAIEPSVEWAFDETVDLGAIRSRLEADGWQRSANPHLAAGETELVRRIGGVGAIIVFLPHPDVGEVLVTGGVDHHFCS